MDLKLSVLVVIVLIGLVASKRNHGHGRIFRGYKIDYAKRRCMKAVAKGFENPFPYKSWRECNQDFKGHGNICSKRKHPCLHGGECMPIQRANKRRTFKCLCAGTGYYGKHCQHKCLKRTRNVACLF